MIYVFFQSVTKNYLSSYINIPQSILFILDVAFRHLYNLKYTNFFDLHGLFF